MRPQTDPTDPPLRADAARNRALILAAAHRQLADGAEAIQMNVLAHNAGVGVGTVYRHFPTIQLLLEALAVERFRELVDVTQSAATAPDPVDGLRHMFEFALTYAADPGFAAVLEASEDDGLVTAKLRTEFEKALRAVLRRAHRAGRVRKDIHVDDVVLLLCGFQHSVRVGGVGPQRAKKYLAVLVDGITS